jgi:Domain of unknown function (DUF4307)
MAQGTVPAPPADRYGVRRSGGARIVRALAAGVLLAGLAGWAVWVGWSQAQAPVRWQDGTLTRVDDGLARFSFDVTTDPGHRVVCTVRVFNDGLTEVGRIDVPAGPSQRPSFSVTAQVPTFEAASSGAVRACAVRDGPG